MGKFLRNVNRKVRRTVIRRVVFNDFIILKKKVSMSAIQDTFIVDRKIGETLNL